MKYLLLSFLLFHVIFCCSQQNFGGNGPDYAKFIEPLNNGYVVVGNTSEPPKPWLSPYQYEICVIKALTGTYTLWEKYIGGNNLVQEAYEIHELDDHGFILAGFTATASGDENGLVVRLDMDGNIIWQKEFGGSGKDSFRSIKETSDGGFIVTGTSHSSDSSITNKGGSDFWLVKLNGDGLVQWQRTFGGSSNDKAYSVQQTIDGRYIAGGMTSSANGDVTGHHGKKDYWIVKVDANGNLLWQKTLGGSDDEEAFSLEIINNDKYILAGYTSSTEGDISQSNGLTDWWLVQLDKSGNLEGQRSFGTQYEDTCFSVSKMLTGENGFVIGGSTYQLNPQNNRPHQQAWILRIDSLGFAIWQETFGESRSEQVYSVQSTPEGKILAAGATDSYEIAGRWESDFYVAGFVPKYPGVSITAPSDNSTIVEGSSIFLNAQVANSNDSTVSVEWFVENTRLGSDSTPPFEFLATNVPTGNYRVHAKATFRGGYVLSSDAIRVTVLDNERTNDTEFALKWQHSTGNSKSLHLDNGANRIQNFVLLPDSSIAYITGVVYGGYTLRIVGKDGELKHEYNGNTGTAANGNYVLAGTPDGDLLVAMNASGFYEHQDVGVFVAKYDSQLNELWRKIKYYSRNYSYGVQEIEVLPGGEFVIAGDYGPIPNEQLRTWVWIVKYNAVGDILFEKYELYSNKKFFNIRSGPDNTLYLLLVNYSPSSNRPTGGGTIYRVSALDGNKINEIPISSGSSILSDLGWDARLNRYYLATGSRDNPSQLLTYVTTTDSNMIRLYSDEYPFAVNIDYPRHTENKIRFYDDRKSNRYFFESLWNNPVNCDWCITQSMLIGRIDTAGKVLWRYSFKKIPFQFSKFEISSFIPYNDREFVVADGISWLSKYRFNKKPTINATADTVLVDNILPIFLSKFRRAFMDEDNDTLAQIKLTTLPRHGKLSLNDSAISQGTILTPEEIQTLYYTPDPGYVGTDVFIWNGSDKDVFSNADASYQIEIETPQEKIFSRTIDLQLYEQIETVNDRIIIYPNPSSNFFIIKLPTGADKAKIKVIDALGRVVEQRNTVMNQVIYLGSQYRRGIYFVEIIMGKQRELFKVIKL